MKTFSGDSCNALTELRSYRVPPPITFATLQCVLMLCGHEEDDCRNWARMRTLCNYRWAGGVWAKRVGSWVGLWGVAKAWVSMHMGSE